MKFAVKDINSLEAELLQSGTGTIEPVLSLDFAGYIIEVKTNSPALGKNLRHYFSAFVTENARPNLSVLAVEAESPEFDVHFEVKTPDPGKSKIKEEYYDLPDGRLVRKRLTGMVFLFGEGVNLAVGPCLENANQVINFINNRFIAYKLERGCLLGHAAGVARQGKGLALAGFSGMGKSTLALQLMSCGTDFVSNDRLLVTAGDRIPYMYGVAKLPRINPGTALNNPDLVRVLPDADRHRFGSLETDELWELEHKYDVFIDECFGGSHFQLEAPMDALVILNWSRREKDLEIVEADQASRRRLLPAFMKSTGLFYLGNRHDQEPADAIDSYLELLAPVPIYEFKGGPDFARAAEFCLDLI